MAILTLKSVGEAQKLDEGYAEFLDGASVKEVQQLLDSGKSSSATARQIFEFVNKQPQSVYVFPIRHDSGLGSQYMTPDQMGHGVVFFNLTVSKTGKINGQPFPPVVQLYHELGHAKQYVEWGQKKWDEVIKAGTTGFNGMISKGQPLSKLSIPYPMVLESDNMSRHEFPICDELKCVKRSSYMDLKFT